MHIFALETDMNKIKDRYCGPGEPQLHLAYYHGMSFFFAILREIITTIIILGLVALVWYIQWPFWQSFGILFSLWFVFVFFNLVRAYIDWNYDFILLTTDNIIIVDQTSIFKQEIKPIHLENIGSVTTQTQFWGIFSFGKLQIHLKEGLGGDDITKRYIPHVDDLAGKISGAITMYQRGKSEQAAGE